MFYPGATIGPGWRCHPPLRYADPLECLSPSSPPGHRAAPARNRASCSCRTTIRSILAKQLATIDVLSKGRMRQRDGRPRRPAEREAMPRPASTSRTRGRRADEAIDVLRLLWGGGEDGVTFDGEFFAFDDICAVPRSRSAVRHLPLHVGGSSRAAARRAGRSAATATSPAGCGRPRTSALVQLDVDARGRRRAAGRRPGPRWSTPGGARSTSMRPGSGRTPTRGSPAWCSTRPWARWTSRSPRSAGSRSVWGSSPVGLHPQRGERGGEHRVVADQHHQLDALPLVELAPAGRPRSRPRGPAGRAARR